jgi:Flp pilus assembly protein protease CpaA
MTLIALVLFLIFALSALGVGVLASVSDIRGLTIPNLYSILIAAAFVPAYGVMWVFGYQSVFSPLWSHIAALVLIFILSAALFHFKVMGAADSKMASAYALWLGLAALPIYLFIMTLCGAVLGAVALYIKKKKPFSNPAPESWAGQLQAGGSKVPYGAAIFCGALYAFYSKGYIDIVRLSEFFGGA